MKHSTPTPIYGFLKTATTLAMLALGSLLYSQTAAANSGADATILNIVTVSYFDATGVNNFSATASTSVTVNLVEAALSISGAPAAGTGAKPALPSDLTGGTAIASGQTGYYFYALTANANGDATYDLGVIANGAATDANSITIASQLYKHDQSTAISGLNPATVTLGASVVTAVLALDQLEFAGGTLGNISVGDIVVVTSDGTNYIDYKVTAVTLGSGATHDNAGAATHTDVGATVNEVKGSLTLAINPDGNNTAPGFAGGEVGRVAAEQVLVRAAITATATASTPGTVPHIVKTATTTDGSFGTNPVNTTNTTSFIGTQLSIKKEVQNISSASGWLGVATGDPGEYLEYRVTVANAAAGGTATKVTITDAIPAYTTLATHTTYDDRLGGTIFAQINDGTNTVNVTLSNDSEAQPGGATETGFGETAGGAVLAGTAVTFHLGDDSTKDLGGQIAGGSTYTIIYQVKID